tara:strand:+ start:190 stop:540 length:351 start_codon:yes stop_codon:yes gene_type:complete
MNILLTTYYLTVTASKMLAWSPTKTKTLNGSLGSVRMVTYDNRTTAKTDSSTWLHTDYKASDYQTLVDGGFSEMYVDESNDTYYSQSELEEYKSKHPDTSVTIANSNSTAVDNFVS